MKTSIIIPTFNGAQKISNVLKALEEQEFKDFEIIVVIDGSTDNTLDLLQNNAINLKQLKIIQQANGGRSVSRNNGAKLAQGEILVFFDDDMRPTKECVGLHVQHHKIKPGSIMVGSQIEDLEADLSDIQKYKGYLTRLWERPLAQEKGPMHKKNLYLTAANFSIAKKVFIELGGFDERLTDAEDFDLGVKAVQANIPVYFNPAAIGWHDDFITCKSYIKRQIQYRKAHDLLKKLKPDLYHDFNNHQMKKINPLKKAFYYFFSFSFWPYFVDNFNWLLIFPPSIRYKIYDYIITGSSLYYPEK